MQKYPNNYLDFCRFKQFCGELDPAIRCNCFNAKTMCPAGGASSSTSSGMLDKATSVLKAIV